MKSVAVLVGSLRRESINRKFAQSIARLASDRLHFQFVEIGALPLYDQDFDDQGAPPKAWTDFRAADRKSVV